MLNHHTKNHQLRKKGFHFGGLRRTLFFSFLIISLIPMTVVSLVSFRNANHYLHDHIKKALHGATRLKLDYMKSDIERMVKDLKLQSQLQSNKDLLESLSITYRSSKQPLREFVKGSQWKTIADYPGKDLRKFIETYGYYDVFLIDLEGNILFTVKRENDLGTNLFTGKYSDTQFGKAAQKAIETGKPIFSDIAPYAPSNNSLASSLVQIIVNEQGEKRGLVAFQVPMSKINQIMGENVSLGETAETYLVGKDLLMRSDSRFEKESTILKKRVDTELTMQWLAAEKISYFGPENRAKVITYNDYRGVKSFGLYRDLHILHQHDLHWGLIAKVDVEESFRSAENLKEIVIILFLVTTLFVLLGSLLIANRVVTPLKKLSNWAKKVAIGDLTEMEENVHLPNNEIRNVYESFDTMVNSLRAVSDVCVAISIGDFSKTVSIKSEKDLLSKSVNQMRNNLNAAVQQANRVARGDYTGAIELHSKEDELGKALSEMTVNLREFDRISKQEHWLKSGYAELHDRVQGEQELSELCHNIITFLAHYLEAQIGVFYLLEPESNKLKGTGYYAYPATKRVQEFAIGEGLVGQAAREKNRVIITDAPTNYLTIRSATVKSAPSNILIQPICFEKQLKAVIELGTFHEFSDLQLEFLDQITENIGIIIHSALSGLYMRELLKNTQQQAEKLEVQTKALKESESRLQIQQEQLRAANEELEQKAIALETSTRYKSEFLANMSHELRSPLNSLLLLAHVLGENETNNLTPKQVEFAKIIHSSGEELLHMINEILDLSKIEAGMKEIIPIDMLLEGLGKYVKRNFQHQIEQKKLNLIIQNEGFPFSTIFTDQHLLEQIIKNLLSNAMKFTEEGSIIFKLFQSDKFSQLPVGISVTDTGIGIPKEKQQAIFEAFQQADGSTNRRYGGTGLGLSISKKLIQLLGGKIDLRSETGQGSCFTIYLPEKMEVEEKENESEREELKQDVFINNPLVEEWELKDKQILIVDDDPRNVYALSHFLEKKGAEVLQAFEGNEALNILEKHPTMDLTLVDIMMPQMDGYETMRAIREVEQFQKHPIIALTAKAMKEDRLKCIEAGANDYLTKPVNTEQLLSMLHLWL